MKRKRLTSTSTAFQRKWTAKHLHRFDYLAQLSLHEPGKPFNLQTEQDILAAWNAFGPGDLSRYEEASARSGVIAQLNKERKKLALPAPLSDRSGALEWMNAFDASSSSSSSSSSSYFALADSGESSFPVPHDPMALVPWAKHYLTPESPCRMWEICSSFSSGAPRPPDSLQARFSRVAFSPAAQVEDVELANPHDYRAKDIVPISLRHYEKQLAHIQPHRSGCHSLHCLQNTILGQPEDRETSCH